MHLSEKIFIYFYLLCFTACEEIGNRASHASCEALLPGKNATNDVICYVHDDGVSPTDRSTIRE
jgi:hypothetical protein